MEKGSNSLESRLVALLAPEVTKLGYELLHLEYQVKSSSGGPVLRIFIENPNGNAISFDDCAAVDHGLDPIIESQHFESILPTMFMLEVSSPGLDRPLKKPSDFQKFVGQKAIIKTFRPLSLEEMGNPKYFEHHQKQKNFAGILRSLIGDSVELETDKEVFKIPLSLITKAHLDVAAHLAVENNKSFA